MAWPMHLNHRQHDEYSWERPPRVEEGQTAEVHAPRAAVLLERMSAMPDAPASDRHDGPLDSTA